VGKRRGAAAAAMMEYWLRGRAGSPEIGQGVCFTWEESLGNWTAEAWSREEDAIRRCPVELWIITRVGLRNKKQITGKQNLISILLPRFLNRHMPPFFPIVLLMAMGTHYPLTLRVFTH
jgi:hypothetical protein